MVSVANRRWSDARRERATGLARVRRQDHDAEHTYAVRGLVGWTWRMTPRVFLTFAAGASRGRESGRATLLASGLVDGGSAWLSEWRPYWFEVHTSEAHVRMRAPPHSDGPSLTATHAVMIIIRLYCR